MGQVTCESCGAGCIYYGNLSAGECYGEVVVTVKESHGGDVWKDVHTCEAHKELYWTSEVTWDK